MYRWAVVAAVLAAPVLIPSARAASTLEAGAPKLAEQRYAVGRELYRKDNIEGAASEFATAFALFPTSAKLAYNLARCEERLGRLSVAIVHYGDYLRLSPDATDRAEVEQLIAALRLRNGGVVPADVPPPPDDPAEAPSNEDAETEPALETTDAQRPPDTAQEEARITKRPVSAFGVQLILGANGKLKRGKNGATQTTDELDVSASPGVAATWDTPMLLEGLRVGVRLGADGGEVDDLGAKGTIGSVQLGARVRYVGTFLQDWIYYGAINAGPSIVSVDFDTFDGGGTGFHVALEGGAGYRLWGIPFVLGLVVLSDSVAELDIKGKGPLGSSTTIKDNTYTRTGLTLGAWF